MAAAARVHNEGSSSCQVEAITRLRRHGGGGTAPRRTALLPRARLDPAHRQLLLPSFAMLNTVLHITVKIYTYLIQWEAMEGEVSNRKKLGPWEVLGGRVKDKAYRYKPIKAHGRPLRPQEAIETI